jgi:hypothetical protein
MNSSTHFDYCAYKNNLEKTTQNEFSNYWSHIELGAGNYGLDGHTKTSQYMTILMEFKYVSDRYKELIDSLPESNPNPDYDPYHQYAVLFDTLDQLVDKYGPKGIFHINDLFQEYCDYAALQLREYAKIKGYKDIIIEVIPGDYTQINPETTLEKYSKHLYDSAHLKNPELSFYNYGIDGSDLLSNNESREYARLKLQKLADLSFKGLYFFPTDPDNLFIPTEEKVEFISQDIFYHATNDFSPVPYYFPEGDIFSEENGYVYWIDNSYSCL